MRKIRPAVLFLFAFAVPAFAEEIQGQIKAVDAEKGILTVTVGEKDREFMIPADAKIQITEAVGVRDAKDGLKDKDFVKGFGVKITLEKKEGKEVVTKVLVLTGRRADG